MNTKNQLKNSTQLVWGLCLIVVGIAVFFKIPHTMPQLAEMGQSSFEIGFKRFCLYFIGIVLVGGGARKIFYFIQNKSRAEDETASGSDESGSDR